MEKHTEQFNVLYDSILKEYIMKEFSKKYYRFLKRHNARFFVDNNEIKNHEFIKQNQLLTITHVTIDKEYINPLDIKLDIVYEDNYLMVINKPYNLQTIPSRIDNDNSLYNVIMNYYKNNKMNNTIHFINRLDKKTSGLLLVAKDRLTALKLNKNIDNIDRYYYAMVEGILDNKLGRIKNFIDKDIETGKRYVSNAGKEAITNYEVIKEDISSILRLRLETGRTHQIRVHLSHLGHPIIGDDLYGNAGKDDNLYLCSYRIEFINPYSNDKMRFEIKPDWIKEK